LFFSSNQAKQRATASSAFSSSALVIGGPFWSFAQPFKGYSSGMKMRLTYAIPVVPAWDVQSLIDVAIRLRFPGQLGESDIKMRSTKHTVGPKNAG